jgi:hypothetical protein
MAHSEEVVRVHLVIWIRKALHRAVKLYCLNHETAVMEFVIEAIQEKLATSTGSWSGSPPMVEGVSTAPPKAYELSVGAWSRRMHIRGRVDRVSV